jgi:hypothetical protein
MISNSSLHKDEMSIYCKAKHCRYSMHHTTAGHQCGVCHNYGHGQVECKDAARDQNCAIEPLPVHLQSQVFGCKRPTVHTTHSHISTRSSELTYDTTLRNFRIGNIQEKAVKCPLCRVENKYLVLESLKVFGISQKCVVCTENEIDTILPVCRHACFCKGCLEKSETKEVSESSIDPGPDFDEYSRVLRHAATRLGDRNMVWVAEPVSQGCAWYFKRVDAIITGFFMHGDNHGQYGSETDDVPRLERFLDSCVPVSYTHLTLPTM